jgi:uncharacterized protein (DUF2141 family)
MKLLLLNVLISVLALGPMTTEPVGSIRVKFEGLIETTGKLAIVLLDESGNQVGEYWIPVDEPTEILNVDALKPGNYAVKFFHDANNNGTMDTNWAGIPKESFGFSNNARIILGLPSIKEMLFEVNGMTEIVIKAKRF